MPPTSFLHATKPFSQEQTLPDHLEKFVPEAKLFIALLRLEQRIDANITRSRLQAIEMLNSTSKTYRILRIFLSHSVSSEEIVIHVQGQLVNPDTGNLDMSKYKFSDFVRSAVVVLDSNIFRGKSYSEWTRSNESEAVDGFELHAPLTDSAADSFCRIQLMMDDYPRRYTVPEKLAAALGCQQETFDRLMMALWAYIKRNNLQADADDPMNVEFNDVLSEVFGCSQMSMDQIGSSLLSVLSPAEPVTFLYHLTLSSDPLLSRQVYEIALQIPRTEDMHGLAKMIDVEKATQERIEELELRCSGLLKGICQHQSRHEMMLAFSESPVDVSRLQLESAKQNLKILQYGSPQASVSSVRRKLTEHLLSQTKQQ